MNEQEYKYMVCTRCMTYNQAAYIKDALNGFAMQETTYPVVNCIIDDASTDGEQDILRDWAEKNLNFEAENARHDLLDYGELMEAPLIGKTNLLFVIILLKENHFRKKSTRPYFSEWQNNSKYIAICEGDDYWNNPGKIQKQVDFLETHNDYGMCYCSFIMHNVENDNYVSRTNLIYKGINELIVCNYIPTLTTLFRRELEDRYYLDIKPSEKGWTMGDYPKWLWMELESKIYYMDDVVAVYRSLPESLSHYKDYNKQLSFLESTLDIQLYYYKKYSLNDSIKSDIMDAFYRSKSLIVNNNNDYKEALKCIKRKTLKEKIKYIIACWKSIINS